MTTDLLNDSRLGRLIEEALFEDVGLGDVTTEAIVRSDEIGKAILLVKERGVIAGLDVAALVFRTADPGIVLKALRLDGAEVQADTVVALVEGPTVGILKAERTALNFLQRMSGIATLTKAFVNAVKHTRARITDTRKTAPSLRIIDKLAVQLGGGVNHRFGLDDMVLIKDNHIAAAGDISAAITKCLSYLRASNIDIKVEVEAKDLEEVRRVLEHPGIHRIMLDNFSIDDMRQAVNLVNHSIEIEASGGITLDNVRQAAETGVDFISVGALTHSPRALDISLEFRNLASTH
jgi:nicotinate-nucleotide pyrophosphorylase (carboxylating)